MIDLQRIRTDKKRVIDGLHRRGLPDAKAIIDSICELDQEKRTTQAELENLTATLNKLNQTIGHIFRQEGATTLLATKKEAINHLKEKIQVLKQAAKQHTAALRTALYALPNLPHKSVPIGKDANNNLIVYQTPLQSNSGQLAHWDLIKKYGLVDFELGNKITGAGFPVYKGKGAKLQRALINFFLDQAEEAGYIEIQPPILVNQQSGYATGQLPDKEGQMYHIPLADLYLIPTAEVPITNIYRDTIIATSSLPIKHVAYTPCFRREAGSWGADVRGLNRLHQFDKVELVQICHPSDSYTHLESMLAYVQRLVEKLELPYRVLKLCEGDLGFCAAMTYDIEVYAIGQNKWLEVSSISNFDTFQANRLSLRYKNENKKSCLLHTLNGSGLALPRILAALLETYQRRASIAIPKVLQPYTRFDTID